MSEDHLGKLRLLEKEYFGQPPIIQQADLGEINRLRSELGLPVVDARLNEMGDAVEQEGNEHARAEPEEVPDHTEAREVYQAYLKKIEELEAHRAYADQVARATAGHGQTPVRP